MDNFFSTLEATLFAPNRTSGTPLPGFDMIINKIRPSKMKNGIGHENFSFTYLVGYSRQQTGHYQILYTRQTVGLNLADRNHDSLQRREKKKNHEKLVDEKNEPSAL